MYYLILIVLALFMYYMYIKTVEFVTMSKRYTQGIKDVN